MDDPNAQNANPGDGGQNQNNGDGHQSLGWKTELPEALRGHEAFAAYNSKAELYKGVIDLHAQHKEALQKLADTEGRMSNYIPKLTDQSTDADKAAYRAALGIPDKAEDYEIVLPDGADDSLNKAFRAKALELGMPKEMAKGLGTWWNGMIETMVKTEQQRIEQAHNEALEALKREWGPDATVKAETIKKGYAALKSETFDSLMQTELTIGDKKVRLGDHPAMVSLILEIGKKVSPDSIVQGGPSGGQPPQDGVIRYNWGNS